MSFLKIDNPMKRNAMVDDYIETVHKIQKKNMNEKLKGLAQEESLNTFFKPIIQTSTEATKEIRNDLKNISIDLQNKQIKPAVGLLENAFKKHGIKDSTSTQDPYWGIYKTDDGGFRMGASNVILDKDSNITVDGKEYKGTSGLWHLIMDKQATKAMKLKPEDFNNYRELVLQTDVMNNPAPQSGRTNPKGTYKWRKVFSQFNTPINDDEVDGDGIIFLPSSIKSMHDKLTLLLGSYQAGNQTSTRNEITAILDELRRRKAISLVQYNLISTFISPK